MSFIEKAVKKYPASVFFSTKIFYSDIKSLGKLDLEIIKDRKSSDVLLGVLGSKLKRTIRSLHKGKNNSVII